MCGLIAILAKNKNGFFSVDKDIFTQLLYTDVLRGSDATGVFGVKKNGNIDILKQATPAGWFIASKEYQEFAPKIVAEYQMLVGHNRKATHGDRKDIDAHPFYTEPICLVHNGMISNHKELCKESTVDSNAVCNAFAEGEYKEVLADIEGAYAFIWYNIKDKAMRFIRNDKRPLFIIETNTTYILASEKEMVIWICTRNNQTIVSIKEVAVGTIYTYDLETREMEEETLPVKEVSSRFHFAANNTSYLPSVVQPPKSRSTSLGYVKPLTMAAAQIISLTDDDFAIKDKQITINTEDLFERGDYITFEVEEIEDYKTAQYTGNLIRVAGGILNCPRVPITVIGYIPKNTIDQVMINFVASGFITNINKNADGSYTIYTHSAEAIHPVVKSFNNYWITDKMWMEETFENTCMMCNEKVTFEELSSWDIYPNTKETTVCCPKCMIKENLAC